MGEEFLKGFSAHNAILVLTAFSAGIFAHFLYQRWNSSVPQFQEVNQTSQVQIASGELQSFRVGFAPLTISTEEPGELPVLQAIDVEKIRGLAGKQARIRGRIFRVSHSAKSNTYFLNFGPSRAALTAVIFASAVDLFEKNNQPPRGFDGREVELHGQVKDHPQYGLEVILESPLQIKILK